jgi:hypothetical protein
MRPDAAAVAARMAELGLDCPTVATGMRRRGLPGTSPHWVSMLTRGKWDDLPEGWVTVVAAVLGVPVEELIGRPVLVVIRGGRHDLHR